MVGSSLGIHTTLETPILEAVYDWLVHNSILSD